MWPIARVTAFMRSYPERSPSIVRSASTAASVVVSGAMSTIAVGIAATLSLHVGLVQAGLLRWKADHAESRHGGSFGIRRRDDRPRLLRPAPDARVVAVEPGAEV